MFFCEVHCWRELSISVHMNGTNTHRIIPLIHKFLAPVDFQSRFVTERRK